MIELREVRRMLEAGRRYLEGKCSIQELYGSTIDLATAVKFWGGHPAIGQVARDWSRMVDRYWNEWNRYPDSISEEEFLTWLERQLGFVARRAVQLKEAKLSRPD